VNGGQTIVARFHTYILAAVLIAFAGADHSAFCQDLPCIQQVKAEDLDVRNGKPGSAVIDAGDGVTFRLLPGSSKNALAGPPSAWMGIAVLDDTLTTRKLPDSYYLGYAYLKSGAASFWMIGEYTGGAHCCARYHFLSRPAPGTRLRYLGATTGSSEGLDEEPFLCRNGAVYFTDADIRFLYFHTSYSQSILTIPVYYRLEATSLTVDNRPFRNNYLAAVHEIDNELSDVLRKRSTVPESILLNDESHFFSDELGQLLVKRTILYLYAGEDRKAWSTFDRDVRKYYGTRRTLEEIKREIKRTMKDSGY
jgi:hypothetical protein